jgi:hypothetical protein
MTYIVGINQNEITSIICDSRLTFGTSGFDGQNTTLKSGLFFPGCVYGAAGNADSIRDFIISCKEELTGRYELTEFWDMLISFISKYSFPKENNFQLILSSRHSGKPTLYLFDSKTKNIVECEDFVSIGSGKVILDDEFKNIYLERGALISDLLTQNNGPAFFYPYIYCLWFMEKAQGMEVSILEKHGVGGYFHFTFQTSTAEHRQHPAVYVLSGANYETRKIYSYVYRIAFEEACLVVDCPIKNERSIIVDSAAWPKINHLNEEQIKDYKKRINSAVEKQPYYNFCGFGFINPVKRISYGIHITNKDDYVVTKSGEINETYRRQIELNFS